MVSKKYLNLQYSNFLGFLSFCIFAASAQASHTIDINELTMTNSPDWLTESRVQNVVDHIEPTLEWDIRKIRVTWYTDQVAFQKLHGFGDSVLAFTLKKDNTISVGPKVTDDDFDRVFGHELVHIILGQKYKDAIPGWLEEGLANYISKHGTMDYPWLASQPRPDVRTMTHPFKSAVESPRYQYMASTALVEMIDKKCGLDDLLGLSVGSKLENYLATTCSMPDINLAFDHWLKSKANQSPAGSAKGNSEN
jgi:hypothetical protein